MHHPQRRPRGHAGHGRRRGPGRETQRQEGWQRRDKTDPQRLDESLVGRQGIVPAEVIQQLALHVAENRIEHPTGRADQVVEVQRGDGIDQFFDLLQGLGRIESQQIPNIEGDQADGARPAVAVALRVLDGDERVGIRIIHLAVDDAAGGLTARHRRLLEQHVDIGIAGLGGGVERIAAVDIVIRRGIGKDRLTGGRIVAQLTAGLDGIQRGLIDAQRGVDADRRFRRTCRNGVGRDANHRFLGANRPVVWRGRSLAGRQRSDRTGSGGGGRPRRGWGNGYRGRGLRRGLNRTAPHPTAERWRRSGWEYPPNPTPEHDAGQNPADKRGMLDGNHARRARFRSDNEGRDHMIIIIAYL